jgi:hypothetical protein
MKKTATSKTPSMVRADLLPEHNFDYRKAKPNRFANRKVDWLETAQPVGTGGGATMTTKLCVFVSSVQKELEDERLIVQNLVNTDAFLSAYCMPVLYELEPASADKALVGCLQSLDGCQVYLLIVGIE